MACFQLRNGFFTNAPSGRELIPASLLENVTQTLQNAASNFLEYANQIYLENHEN